MAELSTPAESIPMQPLLSSIGLSNPDTCLCLASSVSAESFSKILGAAYLGCECAWVYGPVPGS